MASAGLVVALASLAGGVLATPAWAVDYGNTTEGCYGIYWETDWNQDCDFDTGAHSTGTYRSEADCSGVDFNKSLSVFRNKGSMASYDGEDCTWGINDITTWFQ